MVALGPGDEPLLRGLLGDTHALAGVGPGGTRAARMIDEVPDQVVGDLTQMLSGQHGIGQLIQHVGVHLFDGVDQLVEADGVGDTRRVWHAVNGKLTVVNRVNLGLTIRTVASARDAG